MDYVKNENYYQVSGWMINELHLKGNELSIYAIIYGFSQTQGQVFTGSLQYLAAWTNSTKQGVLKALRGLLDKGLIEKNEKFINGIKYCEYYSTKFNGVLNKVEYPVKQSLIGGIKQSLPNNIDIDNIKNNINKKEKEKSIDDVLETIDEELKDSVRDFIKMRKAIKKPMTTRAVEMLLNKLDKLATNNNDKIEMLNQSILHSWQDIYELKTTPKQIQEARKSYGEQKTDDFYAILNNIYERS